MHCGTWPEMYLQCPKVCVSINRCAEGDLLSQSEVGHEGNVGLAVPVKHPLPVYFIFLLVVKGVQVKEGWIQSGEQQGVEESRRGEHLTARGHSSLYDTEIIPR